MEAGEYKVRELRNVDVICAICLTCPVRLPVTIPLIDHGRTHARRSVMRTPSSQEFQRGASLVFHAYKIV
jgi:hypothetical protein